MSVYTAKEIMEIIPHRHPFMLIDTIEDRLCHALAELPA